MSNPGRVSTVSRISFPTVNLPQSSEPSEYRRSVENKDSEGSHVLAAEYELFSSRLLGTEKGKNDHPAIACRGVKDLVCECRTIHNTGSMVV